MNKKVFLQEHESPQVALYTNRKNIFNFFHLTAKEPDYIIISLKCQMISTNRPPSGSERISGWY